MMSFGHGWGWQPSQTASLIHFRQIQRVWAHWYAVHGHTVAALHSYTHPLGSNLGALSHLWSQNVIVCPDWDWQPPQTASLIHIRCIHSVWAHWYAVHGHTVAALHSQTRTSCFLGGFWVTCGVKMISLHHGWGWPPPQTASLIHIRHVQSVWAHWYAVHEHTVAALHSHTNTTWLRCWGSGSLM
jgi:hypothetical protein